MPILYVFFYRDVHDRQHGHDILVEHYNFLVYFLDKVDKHDIKQGEVRRGESDQQQESEIDQQELIVIQIVGFIHNHGMCDLNLSYY